MLDDLRNSGLSRQKEIRLARAEVSEKIGARLQAIVWIGAASVLALVTVLIVLEGVVFALIAWGWSPYLSCLLVAAVLAALTLILFSYGRSLLAEDLLPSRTARQLNQDVKTAKEQLT